MRPTLSDVIVLVYNLAVVLSGGFAVMQLEVDDRWMLLGLSFALALFWTIYFRFTLHDRLVAQDQDDEDADDASPVS